MTQLGLEADLIPLSASFFGLVPRHPSERVCTPSTVNSVADVFYLFPPTPASPIAAIVQDNAITTLAQDDANKTLVEEEDAEKVQEDGGETLVQPEHSAAKARLAIYLRAYLQWSYFGPTILPPNLFPTPSILAAAHPTNPNSRRPTPPPPIRPSPGNSPLSTPVPPPHSSTPPVLAALHPISPTPSSLGTSPPSIPTVFAAGIFTPWHSPAAAPSPVPSEAGSGSDSDASDPTPPLNQSARSRGKQKERMPNKLHKTRCKIQSTDTDNKSGSDKADSDKVKLDVVDAQAAVAWKAQEEYDEEVALRLAREQEGEQLQPKEQSAVRE
ncbi:hypothetical protein B0H16DRAFT_1735216 [Mycena metata]|uniref:Uncharacterized protein n=1 Tax=Mycena metata TaxID=1033252 RepID=A0AAD7HSQ0_9AGAR|nr:hypothetical protein B0H16DRAFT_1735216 [Mycena metata]